MRMPIFSTLQHSSSYLIWIAFLIFCAAAPAEETDRMPEWNQDEVAAILAETQSIAMYPKASDRAGWEAVAQRMGPEWVQSVIQAAESDAQEDIPTLPARLFLDVQRTGTRVNYERQFSQLRRGMGTFAIAECLENKGRFLDPLLDRAWRLCELSNWELPAHTKDLPLPGEYDIDLAVADVGRELAFLVYLLRDQLHPVLVKRIEYEVDRRAFTPYLDPESQFGWQDSTNNWNAVCNCGIIAAALGLEDYLRSSANPERFAQLITKAQNNIRVSLRGFGVDGGTSEGIAYWGYGFGNFVEASALLERRTEGKLSFMEGEHVRRIALLPINSQMAPGTYPSFSDAPLSYTVNPWLAGWLSKRLELPVLVSLVPESSRKTVSLPGSIVPALLTLFFDFQSLAAPDGTLPPHSNYLSGIEWLIVRAHPERSNGLYLAAKSGHNAEHHNHNDVGSFIVQWKGESLLVDPGAPVYTKPFFSSKRYEFFAASSRGHCVPVINGQYQAPGADRKGKVLERESNEQHDVFVVDMTAAYPREAGLQSFVRRFELNRAGDGSILVKDEASLASQTGTFEEALITFAEVTNPEPGILTFKGHNGSLTVGYEPTNAQVQIETYDTTEFQLRVSEPTTRRVTLKVEGQKPVMQLRITPIP